MATKKRDQIERACDATNDIERARIERDAKVLIWSMDKESALAFFGYPPGTPIRVLKEHPETERDREKYDPNAKLFSITPPKEAK